MIDLKEEAAKASYNRRGEWAQKITPSGLVLLWTPWDKLSKKERVIEISGVSAALEVLLNPSKEMIKAAGQDTPYDHINAEECWKDMMRVLIPLHPLLKES